MTPNTCALTPTITTTLLTMTSIMTLTLTVTSTAVSLYDCSLSATRTVIDISTYY